jgi:hypothetical protein
VRRTIRSHAAAAVVVPEARGDGERVGRDERHVRGRDHAVVRVGVVQAQLDERAAFAVQAAGAGLEVGDGRSERAVGGVGATRGEDVPVLDKGGSAVAAAEVSQGESATALTIFHP